MVPQRCPPFSRKRPDRCVALRDATGHNRPRIAKRTALVHFVGGARQGQPCISPTLDRGYACFLSPFR
jgi:hypothetical protein